jgi:hypothetical protein
MNAQAWLAGAGGALEGAAKGWSWEKDYQQKERGLDIRETIAQLREEVRQKIAELTEAGKKERHETPSGDTLVKEKGATERTNTTEAGRNTRWSTPSANTLFTEEGRNTRWNTPSANATLAETGRNTRWATPSGNATLGSETTRRGQDIGASTARRGQDLTFSLGTSGQQVTQRGQDIGSRDRRYGIDRRNAAFQGLFGPTPITPVKPEPEVPEEIPQIPPLAAPGGLSPAPAPAFVGRPPITSRAPGRTAIPPPPPPAADPVAQLATKVQDASQRYQRETDPARKAVIANELRQLQAQAKALKATRQ